MKKIIEKYLENFFSDMNYSKNEDDKYLIPLSLDFIELDWKSVSSDLQRHPIFPFRKQ